jgi:hypothetical protein
MAKSIRDVFVTFLQDEDIRKDLKETIKPIIEIMYNEIYVYLWLLCFYSLFLFFIVLAILVILLRSQSPGLHKICS